MADYSRYVIKAEEKIAQFGASADFVLSGQEYDPLSGIMTGGEITVSVMALLTRPDKKALASGGVEYGDAVLLVSAAGLPDKPEPGALVRMGKRSWRIVALDEVAPDGTPILYKFQVRQA